MNATPETIRTHVRETYAQAARPVAKEACGCAPSCCSPSESASAELGYDPVELAALPSGADLGLGCGNPLAIASLKMGEVVLDLGSGPGMDAILSAKRVGPTGKVIGVDMTPAMLERARGNAAKAGFGQIEFRLGEIEHLPLADRSVDVIISNCVVNLSPEKSKVMAEMARVLKPGGRIALSDVVSTGPVSEEVRSDLALHSACVAGALDVGEWKSGLDKVGFDHIEIAIDESTRPMIKAWAKPGVLSNQFASARITAIKGLGK